MFFFNGVQCGEGGSTAVCSILPLGEGEKPALSAPNKWAMSNSGSRGDPTHASQNGGGGVLPAASQATPGNGPRACCGLPAPAGTGRRRGLPTTPSVVPQPGSGSLTETSRTCLLT